MKKVGRSALLGMGFLAFAVVLGRAHRLVGVSNAIWWPGSWVASVFYPEGMYGDSAASYLICAAVVCILSYTAAFFVLLQFLARIKIRLH
jgi:hypothetical protein